MEEDDMVKSIPLCAVDILASVILLASPTKTPQYCDADEMLPKATTTKTQKKNF
jgi:hypothetical protein